MSPIALGLAGIFIGGGAAFSLSLLVGVALCRAASSGDAVSPCPPAARASFTGDAIIIDFPRRDAAVKAALDAVGDGADAVRWRWGQPEAGPVCVPADGGRFGEFLPVGDDAA